MSQAPQPPLSSSTGSTNARDIDDVFVQPIFLVAGDLIHLSSAALLLSYLLFYDVEVNLLIKLLLFAVIVWIMVRGWTWVILAAILINILVREPRFSGGMIGWDSLFYAWFCLCLVAYATGYRTLRRQLRYWLGLGLQELLGAKVDAASNPASDLQTNVGRAAQSDAATRFRALSKLTASLVGRLAGLLVIVVLATIIFGQLPISEAGRNLWWRRSVGLNLILWPGPIVFLMALSGLMLMSVWSWRALTRDQAGLYLRTTTMTYYFRDVRSILGRLKRLKRKS